MSNKSIIMGNAEMFERVVLFLETAHTNVVRSGNSEMVVGYWLISSLQTFLLELGNDFAFVARQKMMRWCAIFSARTTNRFLPQSASSNFRLWKSCNRN